MLKRILSSEGAIDAPRYLAEAIERIAAGEPREQALPEFLDTFYLESSPAARLATLTERPRKTGDVRLNALAGGLAEHLARQYRLSRVPEWAFEPDRFLEDAWRTCARFRMPVCANT